jgi:hypothetical protein
MQQLRLPSRWTGQRMKMSKLVEQKGAFLAGTVVECAEQESEMRA